MASGGVFVVPPLPTFSIHTFTRMNFIVSPNTSDHLASTLPISSRDEAPRFKTLSFFVFPMPQYATVVSQSVLCLQPPIPIYTGICSYPGVQVSPEIGGYQYPEGNFYKLFQLIASYSVLQLG